jgi:hypothetical protein
MGEAYRPYRLRYKSTLKTYRAEHGKRSIAERLLKAMSIAHTDYGICSHLIFVNL